MKKILLSPGKYRKEKYALVDDDFYHQLNKKSWHVNKGGYVTRVEYVGGGRNNPKYKRRFLHREVIGYRGSKQIDHKNRNKLDNRKDNLRICTAKQNSRNRKIEERNTSGFKGVIKTNSCWTARITINDQKEFLGRYKNKEDAARAYDKAATKYFGEFALTNKKMGLL